MVLHPAARIMRQTTNSHQSGFPPLIAFFIIAVVAIGGIGLYTATQPKTEKSPEESAGTIREPVRTDNSPAPQSPLGEKGTTQGNPTSLLAAEYRRIQAELEQWLKAGGEISPQTRDEVSIKIARLEKNGHDPRKTEELERLLAQ